MGVTMINAKYSERPEEIEVEADHIGLAALSTLLSKGRGSIETSVLSEAATPYAGYITRIEIETSNGLVSISRHATTLKFRGSTESLSTLARNFDPIFETPQAVSPNSVPYHIHIEHYPDHPYIDSDSIPMILFPLKIDR
jgi:hypothetical protein